MLILGESFLMTSFSARSRNNGKGIHRELLGIGIKLEGSSNYKPAPGFNIPANNIEPFI